MMRSRLRRPTSKSMTATLWPRLASPLASEADVVVLPTPPLPDVTTMISVKAESPGIWESWIECSMFAVISAPPRHRGRNPESILLFEHPERTLQRDSWFRASAARTDALLSNLVESQPASHLHLHNLQLAVFEKNLHGAPFVLRRDFLEHAIVAGDRNQFGAELTAINARRFVAQGARECAAAQRAIHVHTAVGQHFGAVCHRGDDHQIASARIYLLAGAHRLPMMLCRAGGRRGVHGRRCISGLRSR